MILGHYTFEQPITIQDGYMHYMIIENPKQFTMYVQELLSQKLGHPGNFILFDEQGEHKVSENIEVVIDPFSLNPNTKGNLGSLYSNIKEEAYDEVNFSTTDRLLTDLTDHVHKIVIQQSISASCSTEIQLQSLLKILGVGFFLDSQSLLENVMDYMIIASNFSKMRLFVFVNLRTYLTDTEMSQLSDFISYNRIGVLFLEAQTFEFSERDCVKVIDNDLCEFIIGKTTPKPI